MVFMLESLQWHAVPGYRRHWEKPVARQSSGKALNKPASLIKSMVGV